MIYESEEIVKRIRAAIFPWKNDITEKRMFGGICFLYKGKMCVGELQQKIIVRIVSEKMKEILKSPFVSPMDFTGKPMKEFIFVSKNGFETNEKLQYWIELGIEHAISKYNSSKK